MAAQWCITTYCKLEQFEGLIFFCKYFGLWDANITIKATCTKVEILCKDFI